MLLFSVRLLALACCAALLVGADASSCAERAQATISGASALKRELDALLAPCGERLHADPFWLFGRPDGWSDYALLRVPQIKRQIEHLLPRLAGCSATQCAETCDAISAEAAAAFYGSMDLAKKEVEARRHVLFFKVCAVTLAYVLALRQITQHL